MSSSCSRRSSCALLSVWLLGIAVGCSDQDVPARLQTSGGDWRAGKDAIVRHDCGVCHTIAGVRSARGTVGPALEGFGRRSYIAGTIPNRPELLVQWLMNPPVFAPDTIMPALGVSEEEARNIAAYLYRSQ